MAKHKHKIDIGLFKVNNIVTFNGGGRKDLYCFVVVFVETTPSYEELA